MAKILYIEAILSTSKKILEKNSYEVITANNGKEALIILENNPNFDLIISDITLPYNSGLEILSKIKNDNLLKNIPIIIISSNPNEDIVKESFRLGADDFIKKPIMSNELLVRVKKLLPDKSSNFLITKKKLS